MTSPIVNLSELEPISFETMSQRMGGGTLPTRFGGARAQISNRVGARKLGYNLTVVPAGKRAYPFHNHRVNEEMFFILEGAGEMRIGAQTFPIRAGDIIACPPGNAETAHQIVNTSDATLRYLAIATCEAPEICDYPDSGKFAVTAVESRGADGRPLGFRYVGRVEDAHDYWEGE